MTGYLPTLLALILCLVLSFLLSGMEAGVFALNRLRVRRLARGGNRQAQILHGFMERPERFLWTILVGNTLANFLILGWLLTKLNEWLTGRTGWIIALFALIVFLFYALADLLPKMLFRAYPTRSCMAAAHVVRLAYLALSPLVFFVEHISESGARWRGSRAFSARLFGNREEMRAVMAEAAQALTREEYIMVNRVLDLQHLTLARVAVPLAKACATDVQTPLREALVLVREKNLSRLPVWEIRDGKRRVAGLLDVTALLFRKQLDVSRPAGEFMTPALFLPETTRLEIALRRLQRAGQRLAIVLGRDGAETGMVSLEDILKLMFGEVQL